MTSWSAPVRPYSPDRRRILGALAASPLLAACQSPLEAPERGPIAAAFFGPIDDGGVHEQGYRGLLRIRDELNIPIRSVDRIGTDRDAVLSALRALAQSDATMIVVHGSEASEPTQRVAWEFPRKRFTLIQGDRLRPNLCIYRLRKEQSAWMAGAAAGLLTQSGVVGHVSDHDDDAMHDLHAAFAAGARGANAKLRVLNPDMRATNGRLELSRIVSAQVDAGADPLFVTGVPPRSIDAVWNGARRRNARLIGEGRDWVAARPDAFVASAVVDTGAAILQVGRDLQDAMWRGDIVRHYGLRYPDMIRLVVAPTISATVLAALDELRGQVAAGRIQVPMSDRDRKLDAAPR